MYKVRLLFLIILIEGYVVLACELLAIRQLIPFVGSSTETIAIVISGVLIPLALGYHFGADAYKKAYSRSKAHTRPFLSIRKILLRNILFSLIILTPGLSYYFLEIFFDKMTGFGINERLLETAIYSSIFLFIPIFLLGQTVPLVSHYLPKRKLSEVIGRMLFFSTVGSLLGAVFSTIVLMSAIGVHNTVIITLGLLSILGILLSKRIGNYAIFLGVFIIGLIMNNDYVMQSKHIVSDNAYSLIRVLDNPKYGTVSFNINHSNSSVLSKNTKKRIGYVEYIENVLINPATQLNGKILDILVIGAGGFSLGLDDKINHYTFVDIDRALKDVAEKDFLKEKLPPNKQFIESSARAYVHNSNKKYDLIIIDVYTNEYSIPMECVTRDFLQDVKLRLKEGGIIAANILSSADFHDKFAVRYDNTFSSVFPVHTRQVMNEFNPWDTTSPYLENVLYIYYNNKFIDDKSVYTDDKNTYSSDMP